MYYSEPEQREYNIISDLYHSGAKRTYKKHVGKIRRKLGDKLTELYDKKTDKHRLRLDESHEADKLVPKNPELVDKLEKEASKRNITVFNNNSLTNAGTEFNFGKTDRSYIFTPSEGNKRLARNILNNKQYKTELQKKIYEDIDNNKSLINISSKSDNNTGMLSHEIGHNMNEDGFITKRIRKYNSKLASNYKKNPNLITAIKRRITDPIEESNATNNGLKLLKRLGASKEEIKAVSNAGKAANRTHMVGRSRDLYKELINKVQIPSRRKINRNGKRNTK